jgi:aldose 1-epimerase
MFSHTQEAFGSFIVHRILNKETKTGFSVVPAQGGILLDLRFRGISILDGYQTPIEVDINQWGKSALLYPFPNRLKDGQYQWNGQTYQFPINDQLTGNALHGLGMTKGMNIKQVLTKADSGSLCCQYIDQGQHDYYPFPFTFCATFRMTATDFEVNLQVTNDGKDVLPFGFGWHPYFSLSEKIEDSWLQLPEIEMIGIDQRMIPTGKRYAFDDFVGGKKIGQTVLDNCFAVPNSPDGRFRLQLKGEKGTLNYWQEAGEHQYKFIQLFTPPMRQSIAIEPMTCNVDAFNNGEGLLEVAPQETMNARFGFSFEAA